MKPCHCGHQFLDDEDYAQCCVGGHKPPCLKCPECHQWVVQMEDDNA